MFINEVQFFHLAIQCCFIGLIYVCWIPRSSTYQWNFALNSWPLCCLYRLNSIRKFLNYRVDEVNCVFFRVLWVKLKSSYSYGIIYSSVLVSVDFSPPYLWRWEIRHIPGYDGPELVSRIISLVWFSSWCFECDGWACVLPAWNKIDPPDADILMLWYRAK